MSSVSGFTTALFKTITPEQKLVKAAAFAKQQESIAKDAKQLHSHFTSNGIKLSEKERTRLNNLIKKNQPGISSVPLSNLKLASAERSINKDLYSLNKIAQDKGANTVVSHENFQRTWKTPGRDWSTAEEAFSGNRTI